MSAFYNVDQPPFNMSSAARAIAAANNGLLFDPEDMSTLFQDAAGTVPVTAVGQPVGLVLDKSQGLALGPELVPQDYLTNPAAWSIVNGTAQAVAGRIIFTANGAGHLVVQMLTPVVLNKIVRTSLSISSFDSGLGSLYDYTSGVNVKIINSLPTSNITSNSKTSNSVELIAFLSAGTPAAGASFSIDNLTIRELYGNHATQPITASRPTLIYENGMYGLQFDGVDDYLNLPYMGLYSAGACSMVAAVDSVTQATDGHLLSERSTASANQKYILSRRLANDGIDSLITNDANTIVKDTNGTTSELRTKTVRSIIDNGQNINIYKEGVLSGYDDYTRSGVLTLNTTTIGASVSTTTTNFMNLKLFGLIITKSALNNTQRLQCEKYLGRKVNVPI